MGNLLGTPITDKETHVGITIDEMPSSSSPDGGGLQYGISSMQGWRVHMEDAHIAQPFLYAERPVSAASVGGGDDESEVDDNGKKKTPLEKKTSYERIPLPNHALFAVFDGHGGKFAAEYASMNFLRVLSRRGTFAEYAVRWSEREGHLAKIREGLTSAAARDATTTAMTMTTAARDAMTTTTTVPTTVPTTADIKMSESGGDGGPPRGGSDDATSPPPKAMPTTVAASSGAGGKEKYEEDRLRLQQLKKRGHDSDERVRAIKEQVRRHFASDDAVNKIAKESGENDDDDMENNTEYQYAQATYDRELMVLLERSLRDAFLDLDAEILGQVRGDCRVEDSNVPYALGHHHSDFARHPSSIGDGNACVVAAAIDHPVPSDDEDAGTTAVVVMTTPMWIVCANAGDSRAVYSRSSHRAVPLSYDHKPNDEDEERRIREAGGYVSGGRVEGDLAVSRGLGDYRFKDPDVVATGSRGETGGAARRGGGGKNAVSGGDGDGDDVPMLRPSEQKVSPVPDIIIQNRDPDEDEFIVIACDGIWDVQTNQQCVKMVADIFAEGERDLGLVCEEGSKDNMTAAVIKFPKQTIGKGGGVLARRESRGGAGGTPTRSGGGRDNNNEEQGQVQLRRVSNPYIPPAHRKGREKDQ
ncbi:hypothetical protein ACHAXA_002686 [Cyclostephanos tholiformis]|uniref:protein-serine/threonine phosphatase n=1 Tax=Cyclostephanos tholiformis TaxID=382380 RepID=A0ABD3S004_9STRA